MVMLSGATPRATLSRAGAASTFTGNIPSGAGLIPQLGVGGGVPGYGTQLMTNVMGGAFAPTQAPQLPTGYAPAPTDRAVQPSLPTMGLGAYGGGGYGRAALPPYGGMTTAGAGGGGGGTVQLAGFGGPRGMEGMRQTMAMRGMVGGYNKALAEARAANERRYQQMLNIAKKTTGQREIDIRAGYAGREAGAMQQLARLGMGGTTIAPTLGMGFEREQSAALDRLADLMQQTKLGIIERREDRYPSLTAPMALAQMGVGGLKF